MTEENAQVQEESTSDGTKNTDTQERVYRTQEDFDKAFARKLERERAKIREEIKAEAEAERKKAQMDEAERLKAEMEEHGRKAAARESAANERIVKADAKVTALELGAKPERIAALLRLADLSGVEVTDGEPDGDGLKQALETTLAEYPEFKSGGPNVGGGGSNPPGGGSDPEKNPWSDEHFNLMEQGRVFRAGPEKARRLAKAAGKTL
jgi:hypothetical protein